MHDANLDRQRLIVLTVLSPPFLERYEYRLESFTVPILVRVFCLCSWLLRSMRTKPTSPVEINTSIKF